MLSGSCQVRFANTAASQCDLQDVWKPDEGLKTGSGACEYCEAASECSVLHVHSHVMRPGLDRTGSAL